jgi:hypothetical protein
MTEEFKENARYTFKQLMVSNQEVLAEFRVTYVGLSSFFYQGQRNKPERVRLRFFS